MHPKKNSLVQISRSPRKKANSQGELLTQFRDRSNHPDLSKSPQKRPIQHPLNDVKKKESNKQVKSDRISYPYSHIVWITIAHQSSKYTLEIGDVLVSNKIEIYTATLIVFDIPTWSVIILRAYNNTLLVYFPNKYTQLSLVDVFWRKKPGKKRLICRKVCEIGMRNVGVMDSVSKTQQKKMWAPVKAENNM